MPSDTSEKGLDESIIIASLVSEAGYLQCDARDFEREHAIDLLNLSAFVQNTQPKAFDALSLTQDSLRRTKCLHRLQDEIAKRGEPELDHLSIIIKAFNDLFGNINWKDADKIRIVIIEELPVKVANDKAYQNAMKQDDKQNARIEHDKALERAIEMLKDHTELFKQFMDNPSFKKIDVLQVSPGDLGASLIECDDECEYEKIRNQNEATTHPV